MAERELTLGDIFGLLVRRWKSLAGLFLATLIIVFVATNLLLSDMYCGETILLVMNSKLRSKQMAQDYLGLNVESYIRLILNKEQMLKMLARLNAYKEQNPDSPLPRGMRLQDFERRVEVQEIRNSDCIRIRVYMENPELAAEYTNDLAQAAEERNSALLGADTFDSIQYIQTKVEDSSTEYNHAMEDLLRFNLAARLDYIEQELRVAFNQRENWQIEKNDLEISIQEMNEKLAALEREKSKYPEMKVLKKSITDSPALMEVSRNQGKDSSKLLGLVFDEEVLNPVYSTLEAGISDASVELRAKTEKLKVMSERLKEIEVTIDQLLDEMHTKQLQSEELEMRKSLAREQYERYENWESEVDAVVASERQDLRIIDKAVVPDKPVGPKRPFIAFVAAVLMTLLAFFALLARDVYHMI